MCTPAARGRSGSRLNNGGIAARPLLRAQQSAPTFSITLQDKKTKRKRGAKSCVRNLWQRRPELQGCELWKVGSSFYMTTEDPRSVAQLERYLRWMQSFYMTTEDPRSVAQLERYLRWMHYCVTWSINSVWMGKCVTCDVEQRLVSDMYNCDEMVRK